MAGDIIMNRASVYGTEWMNIGAVFWRLVEILFSWRPGLAGYINDGTFGAEL